jgi:hypothetical protein
VPQLQSDPPRIPGAIACGADRGHRRTAAARARPDVEAGGARQRPRTGTQIPPSTCTPTSPSSPASSAWTTPPWTGRSPGCSSSAQTATARSGGSTSSVHPPTATPCSCGSFTTHGRAQDVLARLPLTDPVQQVHQAMWRPEYPRMEVKPVDSASQFDGPSS